MSCLLGKRSWRFVHEEEEFCKFATPPCDENKYACFDIIIHAGNMLCVQRCSYVLIIERFTFLDSGATQQITTATT